MNKSVVAVDESARALKNAVRDLLAADGPLAKVRLKAGLPFAHNPEQVELALAYANIIGATDPDPERGGRIAAIAAETGMGKTAAYLSALTLNAAMLGAEGVVGERGMISTRTRALQRQLVGESKLVAAAVALLSPEKPRVRFARRVGRRNYIDFERARAAAAELRDENSDAAALLEKIAELAAREEGGVAVFDELREMFSPEELRGVFPDDLCVTASSSPEAAARHRGDAEKAKGADIVIVNHALALLDARLGGGLFAPRQVAVFDEADTLPDQARAMADERTALETVRLSLAALPDSEAAKSAKSAANRLQRAAHDALKNGAVVAKPEHANLIEAARELSEAAKPAAKSAAADRDLRDTLRHAALSLKHWAQNAAEPKRGVRAVLVPAPSRNFPAFHLRNNAPAFVLSRLWKAREEDRLPLYRAVVFTSATLSPFRGLGDEPEDPRPFLREMGIGAGAGKDRRSSAHPDHCKSFAPEPFGEMKFVIAGPKTPSARAGDHDSDFIPWAAAAIRKASESGGRVLVLVPSFALAEELGEKIREKIPDAIVHRKGEALDEALAQYRQNESAVLLTPSAWEGVDLPGFVDHLVIPRIPFAPRDEAKIAVMEENMRRPESARGVSFSRNAADAARKLKQGIGRGIRKTDDRCAVWILDRRFPAPDSFSGPFAKMSAHAVPDRFLDFGEYESRTQILAADGEIRPVPKPR